LFHRPSTLVADGLFSSDKHGHHGFNFSPTVVVLDLSDGRSRERFVTVRFRDEVIYQNNICVYAKMSEVKTTLLGSMPEDMVDGGDDKGKNVILMLDGYKVEEDTIFGLCSRKECNSGKVASSNDKDQIIIHVFLNEGLTT